MSVEYKSFGQSNQTPKWSFFPEILFFSCCLFLDPGHAFGQTISDFKGIWVNESREYLLNNQKPLPYLQSGFHFFSRQQDDAFTEILEGKWENFAAVKGNPVPKSRKFDPVPQFIFEETSYHNSQFLPSFTYKKNEVEPKANSANLPRIRKPEYTTLSPSKQNFKFYGNSISVSYDRLLTLPINQPITIGIIVDYWKKFQVGNSHHLIGQLMAIRDRLGLNDWGYFLLVKSTAGALYQNDENGATLLSWALMIHSGFDVKIGYNQLGISVLYKTNDEIYSIPLVRINNETYYVDKPISSFPIASYLAEHPGASGGINLLFEQSLNFQGETETKKIQFPWDKKLYEFNLKFNPEVIKFLEDYPQTDPGLFFNAPFTYQTLESLQRQMKPVLAGMKKEVAAAFLQQFVQKSFAYRPYNDLYGYDRFMFPEELLLKEESNDKGKSLLYAWMISNLLNQDAALVEFPGFYSVAIALDQPLEGDNFLVEGKSYTIADPTFENAPIGLVMKEFYQLKPIVRLLNKNSDEKLEEGKIWNLAQAFGAQRSGSGKDYLKDDNENFYITGYIREKTTPQSIPVPVPFVAKFNEKKSLEWMVKFRTDGYAFGLEIKQLDKDEFYLAGSFRGKLESSGKMIQTDMIDPDLFFAQFNRQGEIEWLTKSGLDELDEETKLFYVVRFSRSGDIQSVMLADEDERVGKTGFWRSTNEGLCYIASRYQTTGIDKPGEEASPKPTALFRQNMNRMKQLGIDHSIASLVAVFKSVLNTGNQLSGADLYSFRREKAFPEISTASYMTEMLQKLKLIKNNNGIIEIFTANNTPLKISPYRISNHSHIKVIPLDNNDLKINIIDGIEIELGWQKEKINSMVIELSTGNLILDIGSGHQIITRNLRHPIIK